MKNRGWKIITGGVAMVVATVGIVALAGGASNATPISADKAGAAAPRVAIKMTSLQQQTLQSEIDAKIKQYGGKQIAVNQIAYYNGTVIETLVIPGEKSARALNGAVVTPNAIGDLCPALFACAWDNTNFVGSGVPVLQQTQCVTLNLSSMGWGNRISSIVNNQSSNTQTSLKLANGQIENDNRAPSMINDLGVSAGNNSALWTVC